MLLTIIHISIFRTETVVQVYRYTAHDKYRFRYLLRGRRN